MYSLQYIKLFLSRISCKNVNSVNLFLTHSVPPNAHIYFIYMKLLIDDSREKNNAFFVSIKQMTIEEICAHVDYS